MNKIFCPNALPLLLLGLALFSMTAWAETGNDSDQQAIKPGTCVQEIVKLQEMLHAENQTAQSLMSENKELRRSIDKIGSENRELRETINRIRNEVDGGGYHPLGKKEPR